MTEEVEKKEATTVAEQEKETPKIEVPEEVDVNDFQMKSLNDLHGAAQEIDKKVIDPCA